MNITAKIRKVYNRNAYSVKIQAIKDCGAVHFKQMVVQGGKAKAKGQAMMFIRNISQKAAFVNYPIFTK